MCVFLSYSNSSSTKYLVSEVFNSCFYLITSVIYVVNYVSFKCVDHNKIDADKFVANPDVTRFYFAHARNNRLKKQNIKHSYSI